MRKYQWQRNNNQNESDILHNQFTKYLVTAVQRRKWDYINQQSRTVSIDNSLVLVLAEEMFCVDHYFLNELPALEDLENDNLIRALKGISEKERYVFLSHVLEEKSFEELAEELNLSYKGAAAMYYRSIQKIKNKIGGEGNEF